MSCARVQDEAHIRCVRRRTTNEDPHSESWLPLWRLDNYRLQTSTEAWQSKCLVVTHLQGRCVKSCKFLIGVESVIVVFQVVQLVLITLERERPEHGRNVLRQEVICVQEEGTSAKSQRFDLSLSNSVLVVRSYSIEQLV